MKPPRLFAGGATRDGPSIVPTQVLPHEGSHRLSPRPYGTHETEDFSQGDQRHVHAEQHRSRTFSRGWSAGFKTDIPHDAASSENVKSSRSLSRVSAASPRSATQRGYEKVFSSAMRTLRLTRLSSADSQTRRAEDRKKSEQSIVSGETETADETELFRKHTDMPRAIESARHRSPALSNKPSLDKGLAVIDRPQSILRSSAGSSRPISPRDLITGTSPRLRGSLESISSPRWRTSSRGVRSSELDRESLESSKPSNKTTAIDSVGGALVRRYKVQKNTRENSTRLSAAERIAAWHKAVDEAGGEDSNMQPEATSTLVMDPVLHHSGEVEFEVHQSQPEVGTPRRRTMSDARVPRRFDLNVLEGESKRESDLLFDRRAMLARTGSADCSGKSSLQISQRVAFNERVSVASYSVDPSSGAGRFAEPTELVGLDRAQRRAALVASIESPTGNLLI